MSEQAFDPTELSSLAGLALTNVSYLVHEFDGQKTRPISLILTFGPDEVLNLRVSGNGVGLLVERGHPAQFDLGEFGKGKIVGSLDYDPANVASFVGRVLTHCSLGYLGTALRCLVVAFGEHRLTICNDDDQIRFCEPPPPGLHWKLLPDGADL